MTKVCFVIPAYNESGAIGGVIKDLEKNMKKRQYNYEIVVVDDGSKDDTADVSKKYGVRVIRHIINMGSGSATATGLYFAHENGFDVAATLDADGQHDPKDILNGVDILLKTGCDLLIGSRLKTKEGMSTRKRIGNKGLSLITFLLFGVSVTDSQSGLRIFSKSALENLRWKTSGYEFCSEMIWRAKQQGLKIDEYPIRAIYTDYSKQKGQSNWNAYNIVISLLKRRIVELVSE